LARSLNKVEYSRRPDGKWNKWELLSAANWYGWEFSSYEEDLLKHLDYGKWILVDVVEGKGQ
jgi:hypothetical protein